MSANNLLFWMSARGEGSWQQYRAAVEELHMSDGDLPESVEDDSGNQTELPLYQELRLGFQRIGHAEFFAGAGGADWRVTPPAIAATRTKTGWMGVVVGARTLRLLDRLHRAAASMVVTTNPLPCCPDQILLLAKSAEELSHVAMTAGIAFQRDAPAALLSCIPAVNDASVSKPFPLPFGAGWKIERFSAEAYRWRASTREEAEATSAGLFRFTLQYRKHVLLCSRGRAALVPLQVGKYLVLARRRARIIQYDAAAETLIVPAIFRPPFLVERALILCSGSPPAFREQTGRGIVEYAQVPARIARAAAEILRQEIR